MRVRPWVAATLVSGLVVTAAGVSPVVVPVVRLVSATVAHAQLNAVTATSAANAWAVGTLSGKRTFVEHWNGRSWKVQSSPNASTYNYLMAVSATSTSSAWAVGYSQSSVGCGTCSRTLIEHWNGSRWRIVHSPNVGTSSLSNTLYGVAAVSGSDAWAVGVANSPGHGFRPVLEQWTGTTWVLRSGVKSYDQFQAVTGTSPSNVWAIGGSGIEHWNGTGWQQQLVNQGSEYLDAGSATSPANAWAVGLQLSGHTTYPRAREWTGNNWTVTATPKLTNGSLTGVAATSPTNAWAVGWYGSPHPFILRWNGTEWTRQTVPNVGGAEFLAVTATSTTNAWAVGFTTATNSLIEHWNGTIWKRQ